MTKFHVSVAAVLAASAFTLAHAANGVPGVEANVGSNASDRGLPGVEVNIGPNGDQKNINNGNSNGVPGVDASIGRNGDQPNNGLPGVEANVGRNGDQNNVGTTTRRTGAMGAGSDTMSGGTTMHPKRADRN